MMQFSVIDFRFASRSDEADIRRLLRENPMGGHFAIAMEREPDAFANGFGLYDAQDIAISREISSGRAMGICERVVLQAYINGTVKPMAYIGGLRIAAAHRNRIGIIRGGFSLLKSIALKDSALPFALTSISSENRTALRLLTAKLKGLPLYNKLDDYSTMLVASRRMNGTQSCIAASAAEMAECSNRWNSGFQFGKFWTADEITRLEAAGLRGDDRFLLKDGGQIRGGIAVWDQRSHRQTVVRHYPLALRLTLPVYNWMARLRHKPQMPRQGQVMNVAVASHFSWFDDREATFLQLVRIALDNAWRRGLKAVAFGFHAGGKCHSLMRAHFSQAMEFRTTLFKVIWPEHEGLGSELDGRPAQPELGLL